jgi:hypothetical protein
MLELLENHPKTAVVIKQWLLDKLLESLKDDSLPEDFKQHVREQGMEDDKVAKIISSSPRALFDVFDGQGLYIQITGDNKHGWSWEVDSSVENAVCPSRKDADLAAIVEAFKLLEAKL